MAQLVAQRSAQPVTEREPPPPLELKRSLPPVKALERSLALVMELKRSSPPAVKRLA